jgi:enoyl-CoA hydratase/carnithine racemase
MAVIRITDAERVRTIAFNRPEVLNAFNTELYDATTAALTGAGADDGLSAVVLTGEGRAFSAGQDLAEMSRLAGVAGLAGADASARPSGGGFPALLEVLAQFSKPLLAAVNGVGVGLGFTILAHCDIVLVGASARVKTPFVSLGVAPEAASSYLFPVRMGWQRAAHALFTAEWLSAEELVASGLALRLCPDESVVDETIGLARRIATFPLASLMATKRLMLAAQTPHVAEARRREDAAFAVLLRGDASASALSEFLGRDDG